MAVSNADITLNVAAKVELTKKEYELLADRYKNAQDLGDIAGVVSDLSDFQNALKSASMALGDFGEGDDEAIAIKRRTSKVSKARSAVGTVADEGLKVLKDTFGIIQDVYQRLVQASPLLTSIESLFNLAVQLFFMPLGTKLATEMLPAILELVDSVMEIWEGFEGKSLGELLEDTIKLGAKIFGEYFQDLGKQLAEEGGILGSIGKVLFGLGDFIEDHGEGMLKMITNIGSFIMENLNWLVGFLVGLKAMQYMMGMAQIAASLGAGAGVVGTLVGVSVVGGILAGSAAGSVFSSSGINSYTPPTNVPRGEGIMTNSTTNNSFYINGYTDSDLKDKITSVINDNVNLGRLRGGMS